MSHACHRFWKCHKTLTFCSLLNRCRIPCACHAKRHLNVQKCSVPVIFWLGIVLRATTACNFSTCQLPKVVRQWCVLCILTSKCASRHNGIYLSIDLSIYLSARWKTKKFCETSFMFEHNNVQSETIVRDVLIFLTWQHPKRSNSARLPHFSKFKTSKTKEFCETSFKNGKLSAKLPASYRCVLRFFQSTCLKYCACHGKLMPGHTTCRTCHTKSFSQNWRCDAPKCNSSQDSSARTS